MRSKIAQKSDLGPKGAPRECQEGPTGPKVEFRSGQMEHTRRPEPPKTAPEGPKASGTTRLCLLRTEENQTRWHQTRGSKTRGDKARAHRARGDKARRATIQLTDTGSVETKKAAATSPKAN